MDDLIEGLVSMMNGPDDFVGPVNFGNPKENTILELAEQIIRLTHSKSRIAFRPAPMDDPKRRQPDITLARKQFNWRPKVDLEEGLEKTIQYFKEFLSVA